MLNLKSVKEVCELTGLNRKVLYDYKDVVKPKGYKNFSVAGNDGYKLYDYEAIVKLQQIAIYRQIGRSKREIKAIIGAPDYDSNKALAEQLEFLKAEKGRIESLIAAVESLEYIGTKNGVLYPIEKNLLKYGKDIMGIIDSKLYKYLTTKLKEDSMMYNFCENEFNLLLDELSSIDFKCQTEENIDLIFQSIDNIYKAAIKHLGFFGAIYIFDIAICAIGEGKGSIVCDKRLTSIQGKSFMIYLDTLYEKFAYRLAEIIIEYKGAIGASFEEAIVGKMIKSIKKLCNEYYGLRTNKDFWMIFDYFQKDLSAINLIYGDELNYVFNAFKYYTKN